MSHINTVLLFIALFERITLASMATLNERDEITRNKTKNIQSNKIKIDIYYETLCPGSINFFEMELQPVVEKLSAYLDLKLIPYGFAKTLFFAGRYSFLCQHGPLECFGNKIHSCVINVLRNNTKAALVNSCLMKYARTIGARRLSYKMVMNWCTYNLNVNTKAVWRCVHSVKGDYLLSGNGNATYAKRPPYVPYVEISNAAGRPLEVTGHLMLAVCRHARP
ncbi:hypothetical protein ACJJTC_008754 [Scirpophaga incertulas]